MRAGTAHRRKMIKSIAITIVIVIAVYIAGNAVSICRYSVRDGRRLKIGGDRGMEGRI